MQKYDFPEFLSSPVRLGRLLIQIGPDRWAAWSDTSFGPVQKFWTLSLPKQKHKTDEL